MIKIKEMIRGFAKSLLLELADLYGPQVRKSAGAKLWVLTYHRVLPADDSRMKAEEPGMVVTPDTLRMHIEEAAKLMPIVSLTAWLEDYQTGKPLPTKACAITFDDGWLDNHQYALPILKQQAVPATLFAVSKMIDTKCQFWPTRISTILGSLNESELKTLDWLPIRTMKAGSDTESFRESCSEVIAKLKSNSDEQIITWVGQAERKFSIPAPSEPMLMNHLQLQEFANTDLLDIGSHTRHHYRLNEELADLTIQKETEGSQRDLELILNRRVPLFCYPNGDMSDKALGLVRKNYFAAVSTESGVNLAKNLSLHALKRINLQEDSSNSPKKFRARLACWL